MLKRSDLAKSVNGLPSSPAVRPDLPTIGGSVCMHIHITGIGMNFVGTSQLIRQRGLKPGCVSGAAG